MSSKEPKPVDLRFILGFILIIFLVLVYTIIGEFPIFLIAIPVAIMGVDLTAIIDAWKGKK